MATVAEQIEARRQQKAKVPTVAEQLAARRTAMQSAAAARPYPNTVERVGRQLQIGTQSAGRGVADLVGLPVDMAELALNAPISLADLIPGIDIDFRFKNSFGGGESKDTEALLGDILIDREDMTPQERMGHSINRFATEGLLGGTLLSKAAKTDNVLPSSWTAPHKAPGASSRVVVGDTAAGAGTGAALELYDQNIPEEAQGFFTELIAGLLGGLGGANAARIADMKPGRNLAERASANPDVLPVDPDTALPYSRGDVRRAATLYQDRATSPAASKRRIEEYLAEVDGGPTPTTALIADDPGLLAAERQARVSRGAPEFIEADRRVMDDVSERVRGVRPRSGDPNAARVEAGQQINDQLLQSQQRVNDARTQLADVNQQNEDLAIGAGSGPSIDAASRELDRSIVDNTYGPRRSYKNELYNAAASDPNTVVGTENVRSAAQRQKAESDRTNPVLRDTQSERLAEAFGAGSAQVSMADGGGAPNLDRQLQDAMMERNRLSDIESEARAQGQFGRADTARELRQGINEDIRDAAASGTPGTEALASADNYYRERFAPYFCNGTVSPNFFRNIDRDPTRTTANAVPEATARKFLTTGPTARAAAADLAQILSISPNRKEGLAAARNYLIADAAGKGIIRDGKIHETALARYISLRQDALSQIPEVKAELEGLLQAVREGNQASNAAAGELTAAMDAAQLSQRQIDQGVLKLVLDSEPRKAVQGILRRSDPQEAMAEIVREFAGNPDAQRGWKAAVADYLVEQVTTASNAAVSPDQATVSLAKLRNTFGKNRGALAEVFGPEEMQSLQQVQTRLKVLSNRGAQASSGSATAESLGGLRGVLRAFAAPVGTLVTLRSGALQGGSYERRVNLIADQFPDANGSALKVIQRAHFDPELAKHLLEFPTDDAQVYTWSKKLNQLISVGAASRDDD